MSEQPVEVDVVDGDRVPLAWVEHEVQDVDEVQQ